MMTRPGRFTKVLLLTVALLALLLRETFAFHNGSHNVFSSLRRSPTIARLHFKDPTCRGGRRRHTSSLSSLSALFQIPKPDDNAYSDDCFGLLSLVGGVATMDVVFVGIFVAISTIAATLTSMGSIPANRRVPGVVAGLTLACALAVSNNNNLLSSWTEIMGYTPTTADINPDAALIEIALCSFSIIYSLAGSKDV